MFQYKKSLLDWQITGCGSGPRQNLIVRTSKFPPFSDPDVDERGGLFLLLLFSCHGSNSIPQILVILYSCNILCSWRNLISTSVSLKQFFKKQYNLVIYNKYVIISSNCLPKPYWKKYEGTMDLSLKCLLDMPKLHPLTDTELAKFPNTSILLLLLLLCCTGFPCYWQGSWKVPLREYQIHHFRFYKPKTVISHCYIWFLALP